jgi:sterol desaturase/sphingolipid hydroxylase (fatty acid hydroxylase superfamily)
MSPPIHLEIVFGFLVFALVFVPLERLLPTRRQPALRAGWRMDIAYYVLGCFVGHLSDATSVAAMLLIRHGMGLSPGLAASQPGWLQFLEILFLADFLAYWFHRALHRNPFLWRFHRVHHGSRHMDWLANVRLHPVDKIMGDCFQFVPIFCLGFASGPLLAYTIFLGFQGFLNHSNVRLNFGPLRWVFASPEFHHWHHCDLRESYDRNFSPHFVICDRLFGTALIPAQPSLPESYGVDEPVPDDFLGQLMHPFEFLRRPSAARAHMEAEKAETMGASELARRLDLSPIE